MLNFMETGPHCQITEFELVLIVALIYSYYGGSARGVQTQDSPVEITQIPVVELTMTVVLLT